MQTDKKIHTFSFLDLLGIICVHAYSIGEDFDRPARTRRLICAITVSNVRFHANPIKFVCQHIQLVTKKYALYGLC